MMTGRLTVPRIFKHGSHDSTDLLLRADLYWPDTGEHLPVIQDGRQEENLSALLDTITIE